MLSDYSLTMLLRLLFCLEKYVVKCYCCHSYQNRVSSRLKFKQFCVHDFERIINDKNLKQLFVYYQRQCLGSEPKFTNLTRLTCKLKLDWNSISHQPGVKEVYEREEPRMRLTIFYSRNLTW